MNARIRTVELGQFLEDHAELIAARLERADINWWHKRPGALARLVSAADWGVRLFVDADRLDDARRIADEVTAG